MAELTETGPVDAPAPASNCFITAATLLIETSSGRETHVCADVQDVTSGGIVVSVPQPMEVGRTCTLRRGAATDRVIVHHCERRPNGFLVVLRVVRQERRRDERLQTLAKATVCCEGPDSRRAVSATVTNISQGGLQLELQEPIDPPRKVRVSAENFECVGRICYCCREGDKFLAGVQFSRRPTIKRLPTNFA